jgi:hypothetical protein
MGQANKFIETFHSGDIIKTRANIEGYLAYSHTECL